MSFPVSKLTHCVLLAGLLSALWLSHVSTMPSCYCHALGCKGHGLTVWNHEFQIKCFLFQFSLVVVLCYGSRRVRQDSKVCFLNTVRPWQCYLCVLTLFCITLSFCQNVSFLENLTQFNFDFFAQKWQIELVKYLDIFTDFPFLVSYFINY